MTERHPGHWSGVLAANARSGRATPPFATGRSLPRWMGSGTTDRHPGRRRGVPAANAPTGRAPTPVRDREVAPTVDGLRDYGAAPRPWERCPRRERPERPGDNPVRGREVASTVDGAPGGRIGTQAVGAASPPRTSRAAGSWCPLATGRAAPASPCRPPRRSTQVAPAGLDGREGSDGRGLGPQYPRPHPQPLETGPLGGRHLLVGEAALGADQQRHRRR